MIVGVRNAFKDDVNYIPWIDSTTKMTVTEKTKRCGQCDSPLLLVKLCLMEGSDGKYTWRRLVLSQYTKSHYYFDITCTCADHFGSHIYRFDPTCALFV